MGLDGSGGLKTLPELCLRLGQLATKSKKAVHAEQVAPRTWAHRRGIREAQSRLHMSGKEFIERWDAGKFNGKTDSPAVIRVAMLLPFGR